MVGRFFLLKTSNKLTLETRRKSFEKLLTGSKNVLKKQKIYPSPFFIAVFFRGEQCSPNFKRYSYRLFYTKACCQKSGGY
jgi:hypothetical protein